LDWRLVAQTLLHMLAFPVTVHVRNGKSSFPFIDGVRGDEKTSGIDFKGVRWWRGVSEAPPM
jgi:hypothetical protein